MRIPHIRGTIERRILANYRVDPMVMSRLVPAPFRPKLVRGFAVAGICLIRLANLRPKLFPFPWGIGSENAAHRVAVEWNDGDEIREGVFISRRDSNSRINVLTGGRVFPGIHHYATFVVTESVDHLRVVMRSRDSVSHVTVDGTISNALPSSSVFSSIDVASEFFVAGSVGYSPSLIPGRLDGMELRCTGWRVDALQVSEIHSSWIDNTKLFPPGSAEFDCALAMRNIEHEWRERDSVCCGITNPGTETRH